MTDALDSLLEDLPAEAMPASLLARIHAVLEGERWAERRRRLFIDLASIGGAAIGAVALWPILPSLGHLVPQSPMEKFLSWLAAIGGSPAEAIWQSLLGAADWPARLAESLGGTGLLALSLMVVPLLAMLRRLMPYQEGAAA